MADRGRYDSAMFWLAFGTAAAVIGLALMTIGVSQSPSGANLFGSFWFDGGLGLLVIGALLLLWALVLFLGRRREAREAITPSTTPSTPASNPAESMLTEAVRGYYKEREKLMDDWQKDKKKDRA